MRLQRRVPWLTALAIVVGCGTAFAGIVNYLSAKEELQDEVFGVELPYPSVAAAMSKYWWGWIAIAIALVWISVVYLARRTTPAGGSQDEATSTPAVFRQRRRSSVRNLLPRLGPVTAFSVVGGLAGWY